MSHNRYRVPSRIRRYHDLQKQSQQLSSTPKNKDYLCNNNLKGYICRKHLRRSSLMVHMF